MVKKNCNSNLAQSCSHPPCSFRSLVVLQSYNALAYEHEHKDEILTVKTTKSSDEMIAEIKEIVTANDNNHEMSQILLHTSEQLTTNLLEKLKKECENSKKFKKNLHNVELIITRSVTEVNRDLVSQLNETVNFRLGTFALSSLQNILYTTSTKTEKNMWFVSEKNNLITTEMVHWCANNNLELVLLDGNDRLMPGGVTKIYAYVINSHEGELLIQAIKDNNFKGTVVLIDCLKAFGSSNSALLATMVADGLLEDAVALLPGTKYALNEQDKQDLNTDKHEECLKGTVENLLDLFNKGGPWDDPRWEQM